MFKNNCHRQPGTMQLPLLPSPNWTIPIQWTIPIVAVSMEMPIELSFFRHAITHRRRRRRRRRRC